MPNHLVPCPHCGADIDPAATFCRHCGSSESDGWKEDFDDDDEDDEFDYDRYVKDNHSRSVTNTSTHPLYRLTALILLAAFAFYVYNLAIRLF